MQICLLAEDGMSPALTKNEYGVMIAKNKKIKKEEKEEKEETQPRAELEASMRKKEEKNRY